MSTEAVDGDVLLGIEDGSHDVLDAYAAISADVSVAETLEYHSQHEMVRKALDDIWICVNSNPVREAPH